mgnify:CR=1 FL=1
MKSTKLVALVAMLAATLTVAPASAQTATGLDSLGLEMVTVADGFSDPVFVTSAPAESDRLYAVEQTGRVHIVGQDGTVAERPFLDIGEGVSFGGCLLYTSPSPRDHG